MYKMKNSKYIILSLITIILFLSCTDDHCNSETDSLLKCELIVTDTNLTAIDFIDSLSIYSPEWPDSIHYSEEGSDNSLLFTLSPESDTTEIVFTSKQATFNDTIYIYYQREFVLLSPECGFVVNYKIDTVLNTWNYIDSLEVLNKEISTNENDHIQIYL